MNLRLCRGYANALLVLLIVTSPASALAQSRTKILERNIRAELSFLASDAMQGRGSGTNFERIAAEYIGAQFQQFGLEPAGDTDASGNKTFVQRVALQSLTFVEPPTLKITAGSNNQSWQYGRDFTVASLRTPRINGELQVIDVDGSPARGAVVVVKLSGDVDQAKRQEISRKARTAGAVSVVMLETEAGRKTREAGNVRLPNLPARVSGDSGPDSQFAAISLSKEAFDVIAAMPAGARVEFGGNTQSSESMTTWNAVGMLRGSDPKLASEVVLLSAHLDHVGVNQSMSGDNIFNGADDDASGCVAVMELARVLAAGKRPKRTIYFACFGSEERGGYGSRHFISNSPVPVTQIVADVHFEMLGRPDAAVPPATLWLTGYDRSNLGPELARHGARLVADPHPAQNFFQRSDNYTLALRGIVAHTISSFGLHTDYHRPSDEVSRIDFPFMTQSLNSLVAPIQWLVNSKFRPAWLPGRAPTR